MKQIKSWSLLETGKKNRYFYDTREKRTQLCHPLLFHMLRLNRGHQEVEAWVGSLEDTPVEIPGAGSFSKEEVLYYYQKYLLFKENGFFTYYDQAGVLACKVPPGAVKQKLANNRNVILEITNHCNLDCHYCRYGRFYSNQDRRDNKNLDVATAKQLFKTLVQLWNSPLNHSLDGNITVTFFGGEPLLNVPFIKTIIRFIEELEVPRKSFSFAMVTNALLLEKYMDFLVEKKFSLTISLDGNEKNTDYRRLRNGKSAYQRILANVKAMQKKYPGYFRDHVSFSAVLHNKNSVSEIYYYFKDTFGKKANIIELNTSGIKESRKKEFRETFANLYESLHQSEEYRPIEEDLFLKLPEAARTRSFLYEGSDFCFTDYNRMLYRDSMAKRLPTGTCEPFANRLFLGVDGNILPCESVDRRFVLGTASPDGVELDYTKIAESYNNYYNKMRHLCNRCANALSCKQCFFYLDTIDEDKPVCHGFKTEHQYACHLAGCIDYIEEHPQRYSEVLEETTID